VSLWGSQGSLKLDRGVLGPDKYLIAAMAKAAWRAYLEQVDDTAPDEEVLAAAEEFLFSKVELRSPREADGITLQKLEAHAEYPKALRVQAFLARVLRNIDSVARANEAAKMAKLSGPSPASAASAKALADSLAPPKAADTAKLLKEAGLTKLPFVAQLDQTLIDKMNQESVDARVAGRKAFSFVDFTSKEVLPVWVTPEAVGGKFNDEEALSLTGGEQINSLTQLGQALRSATEGQRFFRSFPQWSAAYWRWVPVAVSLEQISWVAAILHHDLVAKICETERQEGRGPYLAFIYSEILRKQINARALKSDPELDVQDALSTMDKSILEIARTRLEAALRAAGLIGGKTSSAGLAGNAASSMVEQASAAAGALRRQQQQGLSAAAAMANQGGSSGGKGKGAGKGSKSSGPDRQHSPPSSKRKTKKQQYWKNVKESGKSRRRREEWW
jgi:hypothetical protein